MGYIFLNNTTLIEELLETYKFCCVSTSGTLNMAGSWVITQIELVTVSIFQEIHTYLYSNTFLLMLNSTSTRS